VGGLIIAVVGPVESRQGDLFAPAVSCAGAEMAMSYRLRNSLAEKRSRWPRVHTVGNMRVLLTGGAGFIGRHVHRALDDGGHDVRVLDLVNGVDVRQPAVVEAAVSGVDAVCHLAAKVGLGVDVQDLPDYASTNDFGTAVLLAAMARTGVRRLVLSSSMVVYGEGLGRCIRHGGVMPEPRRVADLAAGQFEARCPQCGSVLAPELVTEDAPLAPCNAYAASKLAQEHLALSWARITGGSVAVLRYHNVYGPGLPRDTPYAGVAAIFLSALRRGEAPVVFEDGGQRRDFVHVRDVAAATVTALERHESGMRAYNIGSGTPRTVGALAAALSAVVGGPAPIVSGDYRLGDVRHITADSTRLRAELGWAPRVDFDRGTAELAAFLDL
jgi:dTDP-L-rhamnose 4-epimerase